MQNDRVAGMHPVIDRGWWRGRGSVRRSLRPDCGGVGNVGGGGILGVCSH